MNNLTDYQRKIIFEMVNKKAKIRTNEGANYKVWLYYPNGRTEIVRKDTANLLFLKGYITLDEKSKSNFFEYIYTGKKFK